MELGVSPDEKIIAVYQCVKKDGVIVLNDKEEKTMTYKAWRTDRKYFLDSRYKYFPKADNKTLKETRDDIIRAADALKARTKGFINLYKSGIIPQTAKHLFNRLNTFVPDPMTPEENEWVQKATVGAMIFGTQYVGRAYKSDFCSMYPSIMNNNNVLFPYKQGTFEVLSEFGQDYAVAIYRCEIDVGNKKLFRINKNNYYTSHDVRWARSLGYPINLICDGKPNILYWGRSNCLTGAEMFRKYVMYMFPLKQEKIPFAKEILNSLWGALCEQEWRTYFIKKDHKFIVHPTIDIENIILTPCSREGSFKMDVSTYDRLFVHNWARIKPFLLAKGRVLICQLIRPFIDHIVRIHTDGVISTIRLPCTGNELGSLRNEGYCENVIVKNSMRVIGKFSVDTIPEFETTESDRRIANLYLA